MSPSAPSSAVRSVAWFLYVIECADGSLYTGIAVDPEARFAIHAAGKGAKYTASRRPVALVYSERCSTLSAALKREYHIKTWSRSRKQALILSDRSLLRSP